MTAIRIACIGAAVAALPVVLAGTIVWAAVDAAYRLIEDERYPSIADEAESWLHTLYPQEQSR